MPKLIALPDGSTGQFPDDIDDSAIEAVLRKQFPTKEPSRYEAMSTAEKMLEGAKGALRRVARPMVPKVDGGVLGGVDPSRMDEEGAYYREHKGDLGTAGVIGDVGADVLASIAPVGAANKAAAVLTRALSGAKGTAARVGADIAANAGYAAATAEGDRGEAALAGGLGAAGGRLLARTLGGLARPAVSADARALMNAGIRPTPGQLFGDGPIGSTVRSLEDRAASIPFVGDVINQGRRRALSEYGNAEINAALRPLGLSVRGAGEEAVEAATRAVSDSYDRVLPQVYMPAQSAAKALLDARETIQKIPLLTDDQQNLVSRYVMLKVAPLVEKAASTGQPINGKLAKQLDTEIGYRARQYSGSINPSDHQLGEAFYELQSALRGALQGATPEATQALQATNAAYRQMLPVLKAADRAKARGGQFTPLQFDRAKGQYGQEGSDLNRAARNVLPSTVPDSGTAGRVLLGAGAVGGATMGGPLAAATAAAVLYSGPGMSLLVNGLRGVVPDKVLKGIASLPPEGQRTALQRLAAQVPAVGARIKALTPQVMRALSTQQQAAEVEQ